MATGWGRARWRLGEGRRNAEGAGDDLAPSPLHRLPPTVAVHNDEAVELWQGQVGTPKAGEKVDALPHLHAGAPRRPRPGRRLPAFDRPARLDPRCSCSEAGTLISAAALRRWRRSISGAYRLRSLYGGHFSRRSIPGLHRSRRERGCRVAGERIRWAAPHRTAPHRAALRCAEAHWWPCPRLPQKQLVGRHSRRALANKLFFAWVWLVVQASWKRSATLVAGGVVLLGGESIAAARTPASPPGNTRAGIISGSMQEWIQETVKNPTNRIRFPGMSSLLIRYQSFRCP